MENLSRRAAFQPPSFITSFTRSQLAAVLCTVFDWGILFSLVEYFHVWYVVSVTIGALVGAITNFWMNRYWSFQATHRKWHGQAVKYSLASGLSILLNTVGVYVLTDWVKLHYSISVFIISVTVGVLINYPLHRYFVFR